MKNGKLYIGIDPGLTGAIARIADGEPARVFDLIGSKGMLDFDSLNIAMLEAFRAGALYESITVVIENVHAMPGQGVVSMFGFGRTMGRIEGVLEGYRVGFNPFVVYVDPREWKKEFALLLPRRQKGDPKVSKAEKESRRREMKTKARLTAIELFPELASQLNLVKHDGRAEALLMAEWGRRNA